jgi:hypothetical protein
MKKKIFLTVCLISVFTIYHLTGQTEYPVKTPGGSSGYIPVWNPSFSTPVVSIGTSSLFNTNGKIGIGTTNPLQKLHIENGSILINGNNTTNPDINITKTTGTDLTLYPCISLNNIFTANQTKQIYNSTYQIYNYQGNLKIKSIYDGINSEIITFTPISIDVPSTTGVFFNGPVTMRNNLTVSGTSLLNNRMTINSGDATIELNNPTNTPPTVPSNFQISADNGAGRLISDADVVVSLDKGNIHSIEKFTILANSVYHVGNAVLLFQVGTNSSVFNTNLMVGENVKIYPDGKIWVKNEIAIQNVNPFPDYVFAPDYNLKSLSEVEAFIKANKHLPGIPSASEIDANGIKLGEMTNLLTQKIEELTLYTIELQKQVDELKKQANNK